LDGSLTMLRIWPLQLKAPAKHNHPKHNNTLVCAAHVWGPQSAFWAAFHASAVTAATAVEETASARTQQQAAAPRNGIK
jgi:hypothetical protein